jgi:branched-chain amino acid transport system ATP-binding protein
MPMALLEVEAISVVFGGLAALTDVSLRVEAGTVCAVIGPNGAGKTTLFNAISGYERPRDGVVRLDGRAITGLPSHAISHLGLRRTFQNGGVFGEMTVLENVMVGADRTTRSTVPGVLFGLPGARREERRAVTQSRAMLARVGIDRLAQARLRDLSFGQQRLVEITRALISQPRVLLLDEPAVGLSQAERDVLATTLRTLASEGIAVLLVEHVIDLVMAVSDRVLVLNFGRVLAEGTPAEIRADQAVLEAYLGSA